MRSNFICLLILFCVCVCVCDEALNANEWNSAHASDIIKNILCVQFFSFLLSSFCRTQNLLWLSSTWRARDFWQIAKLLRVIRLVGSIQSLCPFISIALIHFHRRQSTNGRRCTLQLSFAYNFENWIASLNITLALSLCKHRHIWYVKSEWQSPQDNKFH